ncbi:MAG: BrnT family toxin [Xanthobacteraceae bacterium]|nr:BrnT family toxin [Xanthobacteraceae bacterium]
MDQEIDFRFEWDPIKAHSNVQKHGIPFDQAATVFVDAYAISVYDDAHSQHEDRWFTLGVDSGGRLVAVSHTNESINPKAVRIRVISARKATTRERRMYEDGLPQQRP